MADEQNGYVGDLQGLLDLLFPLRSCLNARIVPKIDLPATYQRCEMHLEFF